MDVKQKKFGCYLLGVSLGLFPVLAHALVILQYHHISDQTPSATSTSPKLFEAHLEYLKRHKFDVIGLDELAELIRGGEPLPDKTAVITFDDGYLSVYEEAYPRLRKYGFPFAVFINTHPHNTRNGGFMSWQQMQRMADEGVIFANHSVSHPHLIRRRAGENATAWRERVWHEIKTAEDTIRKQLQQSHRLFAYPFGEYNAELEALLAKKGYLAFGQQSGPLAEVSSAQALPRFPFGGNYGGLEDFATKVNSLPMPLTAVTASTEGGAPVAEPELAKGVARPLMVLDLENTTVAGRVNCFASGQGAIPVKVEGVRVTVQAPEPLPVGRSKYTCTASSGEAGRFYWYSHLFIRREASGGWYEE